MGNSNLWIMSSLFWNSVFFLTLLVNQDFISVGSSKYIDQQLRVQTILQMCLCVCVYVSFRSLKAACEYECDVYDIMMVFAGHLLHDGPLRTEPERSTVVPPTLIESDKSSSSVW